MSTNSDKWLPVISRLLWQVYYRVLGLVSYHADINESFKAATYLSQNNYLGNTFGGNVYWVVEGSVFRWDDVELAPEIKMNVWFFGRQRNTVMARRGWWALYVLDPVIAATLKKKYPDEFAIASL